MDDRDLERKVAGALKASLPSDEGFWARQRAQVTARLPERRPAWRRWTWAPAGAAALAAFFLWPHRPAAPAFPADLARDIEIVQELEFAQDLDILQELDDAEFES